MRKCSEKFSELVRTGKEIRELLEHANAYLNCEGSVISLHGHAANARHAVTHPVLVEWLDEWISMANRAWNEFGTSVAPISEDELKAWVAKQLSHTHKFPHSN
tara:strand:- start:62 stop:370 length:309 start_codon:yes stop_codon:yes gene_type:complete